MKSLLAFFLALSLIAMPALAEPTKTISMGGGCSDTEVDTDTTTVWITNVSRVGHLTSMPNGDTLTFAVNTCYTKSASSCSAYLWDHDGDGTSDRNTLDGNGSTLTRGTEVPAAGALMLTITGAPSANNTAYVRICATS